MNWFPQKVWEPTGHLPDGRSTWSSRPAEPEDYRRRYALAEAMDARIEVKRAIPPDRVLRRDS